MDIKPQRDEGTCLARHSWCNNRARISLVHSKNINWATPKHQTPWTIGRGPPSNPLVPHSPQSSSCWPPQCTEYLLQVNVDLVNVTLCWSDRAWEGLLWKETTSEGWGLWEGTQKRLQRRGFSKMEPEDALSKRRLRYQNSLNFPFVPIPLPSPPQATILMCAWCVCILWFAGAFAKRLSCLCA